jgi:hypothetical protein
MRKPPQDGYNKLDIEVISHFKEVKGLKIKWIGYMLKFNGISSSVHNNQIN